MAAQDEVKIVFGYFERKGNALCYRYESERLIIEPWGADSLRVRAWKTPEMDPQDWALLPPSEFRKSRHCRPGGRREHYKRKNPGRDQPDRPHHVL